jgi:dynein heavy chain, axonemal
MCICVKINTYERLYVEVESMDGSTVFENWFRVDARPFKQSLLNIIRQWSLMFKEHLISHVVNRYANLEVSSETIRA